MTKKQKKLLLSILTLLVALVIVFIENKDTFLGNSENSTTQAPQSTAAVAQQGSDSIEQINENNLPVYDGKEYQIINNNVPVFSKEEKVVTKGLEKYSPLDSLGRCGVAYACLGKETMPTGKRESISKVKPSGWQSIKYDFVDGESLYNRSHLIGWQLSAENANEKNLVTGTRYMNATGMLPFENMIADYIKETNNHVLYRVTPIFAGKELVARGVQMEAYSLEDQGDGICYNVYCFNVQPKVKIDYLTGKSSLEK